MGTCSEQLAKDWCNLAVAAFDQFKDLRGTFHVEAINDDRMLADVSYRMNGRPMSGEFRYLNGQLVTLPKLAGGEVILQIDEIRVPGVPVPDGFVGQMSPHRITNRYIDDPLLGPFLARLTATNLEDGHLVLSVMPGVAPPDAEPEDLRPYVKRALILFGVIMVLFLTVLFLARAAARRKRAA